MIRRKRSAGRRRTCTSGRGPARCEPPHRGLIAGQDVGCGRCHGEPEESRRRAGWIISGTSERQREGAVRALSAIRSLSAGAPLGARSDRSVTAAPPAPIPSRGHDARVPRSTPLQTRPQHDSDRTLGPRPCGFLTSGEWSGPPAADLNSARFPQASAPILGSRHRCPWWTRPDGEVIMDVAVGVMRSAKRSPPPPR